MSVKIKAISKVLVAGIALLVSVGFLACSLGNQSLSMPGQSSERLEYNPPKAESWVLENGLKVMFLPDPELPLISGVLYTKQGSLALSADEQALAGALGTLMRSAGAGAYSARQLDQEVQNLSASVSSAISSENGAFGFSGLASDRDQLFKLLAAVVLQPRFEKDRVELWKAQSLDGIKRRVEDPDTVASISFNQLLYSDSVYGRVTQSKDIKASSIAKLKQLHSLLVRPDQAIFAVTGAIKKEQLAELVEQYFGQWQPRGHMLADPPPVPADPPAGIYLVERPLEQTTIQMGQLGIKRLDPDNMTAVIFNYIFSSGMTGRLMAKLRVEQGLAYSTYGAIIPGVVRGSNLIGIQTKAASTVTAIDQAIQVLKTMQQQPVTDAELEEANLSLSNTFIFKFADAGALVNRYALLELLDYPKDYDLTYRDKIAAITAEQVQEATQRLWDSRKFIIVVVGNKEACQTVKAAAQPNSGSPLAGMHVTEAHFDELLEF